MDNPRWLRRLRARTIAGSPDLAIGLITTATIILLLALGYGLLTTP